MVLKLYPTTLATSTLIISFSQMLIYLEFKIPNKQKNAKKKPCLGSLQKCSKYVYIVIHCVIFQKNPTHTCCTRNIVSTIGLP
jgi:hypothetical protein